jgi:L-ribulose-5-phosphate 3-epimerase
MRAHSGRPDSPASNGRRGFIRRSGLGALAALASPHSLLGGGASKAAGPKVAFNTANLVARVSGYRFELSQWMEQHKKTIAATDEAAWRAICKEIAAAGFAAVEVWEAHAAPESLDEAKARLWRRILDEAGLTPIAYAGGLRPETVAICRWMGIPHIDGGLRELRPEQATALCRESGIRFNVENHPEKSAQEILQKVGGGNEWLGVCIDTGWLGTQGVSEPEVIKACGPFVRHTHVKDVKAAGRHDTCLLGDGAADVAGCMSALRAVGYAGWYSWEDEPEDRNPFDSAVRNREWIEKSLRA